MKRLFVCFMLINALVYSKTLMLANGTLKLNYSDGNSGITNIMNMADGTTYITQIREGIYINNRFMYPTKTELNYVKGTGIISAINYYENDIQTNQHIYMTDRRNLIYLENKVNNPQGQVIHIFYKISPNIKMGRLDIVEKNYKYEDFYFSISNEKDIYFAGESDLINLSLAPLGIKRIKKPEKDIVLFFEPEKGSKLILSPLKINSSYFEYSVTDELRTWETWLKQEKGEQLKRSLITLKMLQNRDGSVFSFDRKRERLKADEMLYVAEAFTNLGYYDNAKRILTYFLTGNKNENSEYLISSYEYSKSKEEIFKTDRFGKIKSYYNSALYLYVFSKYINKSGDTAFFNVNGKELETRVYNYILSKIKNGELEGDSGIAESGNYKKNIATYSMVYLGLTEYKKLLEEDNNSDSLKEIDETIKSFESYFRLNFITNEKLKKSIDKFETPKLKETHYLNQGLVRNNNEYKILIRNLVREYWSSEDLSSVNELEFIKKLELINYSNTLRKRVSDLNKKMEEKNNLFLNKYNEIDVEATAKYLLLQEFLEEK